MHDQLKAESYAGSTKWQTPQKSASESTKTKSRLNRKTAKICRYFEIDPLQLIGSGALLIAAEPHKTNEIVENLCNNRIFAAEIGEFAGNPNKRLLMQKDQSAQELPRPISDMLWVAAEKIVLRRISIILAVTSFEWKTLLVEFLGLENELICLLEASYR